MVSKRFRRCVADNKKILENTTELVIGFHPDLPENQYLCHIRYFTLKLFLRRVKKITKIIVNITDDWLCSEMTKQIMMLSAGIDDLFGEEIELQHLNLNKFRFMEDGSLVKKLIINAQPFLQSAQITIRLNDFADNIIVIGPVLAECSLLQNVKFSLEKWENFDPNVDLGYNYAFDHLTAFSKLLRQLKSVNELELDGYIPVLVPFVAYAAVYDTLNFQIIRFTNPIVMNTYLELTDTSMKYAFELLPHSATLRELEIHYCAHNDNIFCIPRLFDHVSHPVHLKLTFHPHFGLNKVSKIAQLLEKARQKNIDGMQISITFKHSNIDREGKLSIVHSLLTTFDVPHAPQQEDIWQFIRGKLCVNLKLEKFEDESLICHPYPPPGE